MTFFDLSFYDETPSVSSLIVPELKETECDPAQNVAANASWFKETGSQFFQLKILLLPWLQALSPDLH